MTFVRTGNCSRARGARKRHQNWFRCIDINSFRCASRDGFSFHCNRHCSPQLLFPASCHFGRSLSIPPVAPGGPVNVCPARGGLQATCAGTWPSASPATRRRRGDWWTSPWTRWTTCRPEAPPRTRRDPSHPPGRKPDDATSCSGIKNDNYFSCALRLSTDAVLPSCCRCIQQDPVYTYLIPLDQWRKFS